MTGPLAPTTDRIWGPFRALVNLLIQPTRFYGTYEYTITGTDGTTVNGTPNDPSLNLPAINGAQLRADSIATQMPAVGNLCHIVFVDGNPAKFCCVWSAPPPTTVAIAGGADFVALASACNKAIKDQGTWAASGTGSGYSPPPVLTQPIPNVAATKVKAT